MPVMAKRCIWKCTIISQILKLFRNLLIFFLSLDFQLYELDNNPKRKDFLDQLFSFMQTRGELTNRVNR